LAHFFKESVLWAGIFEQVVGQMHKKVLKTMVMPLFYQKQPTFSVSSSIRSIAKTVGASAPAVLSWIREMGESLPKT
jgi:hypothetical protein